MDGPWAAPLTETELLSYCTYWMPKQRGRQGGLLLESILRIGKLARAKVEGVGERKRKNERERGKMPAPPFFFCRDKPAKREGKGREKEWR